MFAGTGQYERHSLARVRYQKLVVLALEAYQTLLGVIGGAFVARFVQGRPSDQALPLQEVLVEDSLTRTDRAWRAVGGDLTKSMALKEASLSQSWC